MAERGEVAVSAKETGAKGQLQVVYIVRALAILGVIAVHASSVPVGQVDPASKMFAGYNFINIFNKYGTPTFIFLSAFVLFYSYYNREINGKLLAGFYKRRFLYILLPYFIFSVFYYTIQIYYSYGESWDQFWLYASFSNFLDLLLKGKTFYHLYFIYISIQFYILFPVLLWLFKKYAGLTKHLIWTGLVIQWAFVLYNLYGWQYSDKGSLALAYLSNYFLGAYCGIYYHRIKDWLVVTRSKLLSRKMGLWASLWIVWLAAGLSHVYIWNQGRAYNDWTDPLLYELLWHVHSYTSSIVLLQLSYWILTKWKAAFANILIHLGVVSFGVYIIHAGILFYYFRLTASSNPLFYNAYVAGGYLTALFLSWIIVGLAYKYVKPSWILFGAQPKSSPYLERRYTVKPRRGVRQAGIGKSV